MSRNARGAYNYVCLIRSTQHPYQINVIGPICLPCGDSSKLSTDLLQDTYSWLGNYESVIRNKVYLISESMFF